MEECLRVAEAYVISFTEELARLKAAGREIKRGAGEASSSTYTPEDRAAKLETLRHDFEEVRETKYRLQIEAPSILGRERGSNNRRPQFSAVLRQR